MGMDRRNQAYLIQQIIPFFITKSFVKHYEQIVKASPASRPEFLTEESSQKRFLKNGADDRI